MSTFQVCVSCLVDARATGPTTCGGGGVSLFLVLIGSLQVAWLQVASSGVVSGG